MKAMKTRRVKDARGAVRAVTEFERPASPENTPSTQIGRQLHADQMRAAATFGHTLPHHPDESVNMAQNDDHPSYCFRLDSLNAVSLMNADCPQAAGPSDAPSVTMAPLAHKRKYDRWTSAPPLNRGAGGDDDDDDDSGSSDSRDSAPPRGGGDGRRPGRGGGRGVRRGRGRGRGRMLPLPEPQITFVQTGQNINMRVHKATIWDVQCKSENGCVTLSYKWAARP